MEWKRCLCCATCWCHPSISTASSRY
jgi:hypothetical protein